VQEIHREWSFRFVPKLPSTIVLHSELESADIALDELLSSLDVKGSLVTCPQQNSVYNFDINGGSGRLRIGTVCRRKRQIWPVAAPGLKACHVSMESPFRGHQPVIIGIIILFEKQCQFFIFRNDRHNASSIRLTSPTHCCDSQSFGFCSRIRCTVSGRSGTNDIECRK
jgi:hypothetical protein